jgi:hypothetical protein
MCSIRLTNTSGNNSRKLRLRYLFLRTFKCARVRSVRGEQPRISICTARSPVPSPKRFPSTPPRARGNTHQPKLGRKAGGRMSRRGERTVLANAMSSRICPTQGYLSPGQDARKRRPYHGRIRLPSQRIWDGIPCEHPGLGTGNHSGLHSLFHSPTQSKGLYLFPRQDVPPIPNAMMRFQRAPSCWYPTRSQVFSRQSFSPQAFDVRKQVCDGSRNHRSRT